MFRRGLNILQGILQIGRANTRMYPDVGWCSVALGFGLLLEQLIYQADQLELANEVRKLGMVFFWRASCTGLVEHR